MVNRLFFVFLFLLPFQMVYFLREPFVDGAKWEYGVVGVYATDLLLVVMMSIALFRWLRSIKYKVLSIKYGGPEMILALLLLWAGVSVFWASDHALALYFFVKLLLAVSVFFLAKSWMDFDRKKVIFVLMAAAVLQSSIGIAQFLSQQSISSLILGMSAHDASTAGSSVLKIDAGRFLRAYGTFPHPNILGGFLGVILVLCISYYVFCIKYERSWKCPTEIVAILSGILIILLGLLLTFSRTAWLGVGMGAVVLGIFIFSQNEEKKSWIPGQARDDNAGVRRRFLKILFALGMAGVVFGTVLHEQIFPRFDTKVIEREGSVSDRITSLQDARMLINNHPIVGVGAGNFTATIIEKGEMGEMGSRPVWSIQPAHNFFLLIWSELGIVGLVLFVAFLGFQLYQGLTLGGVLRSDLDTKRSTIFGIAFLALIPSLFLDHWLWSSHFGLLFLFLLLGLASRK